MITLRKAQERGHANHGWLDSHHTFSFADYHDPRHMGFRKLRVINEDRVQPSRGFGTHPHRDMEIISYVLGGALQHRDSMGTGSIIEPGDVQRMTAGTGVTHSEFNASQKDPVHFLQIWVLPERPGLTPGYEQKRFGEPEKRGKLRLVASRDGRDGSITVHQDMSLYAGLFRGDEQAELRLAPGRHAWVQVARGSVTINGQTLQAGDGAALSDEPLVKLAGQPEGGEVLVFDLALAVNQPHSGVTMANVAVIYYSSTGTGHAMAQAVAEGVKAAGGEARVRLVQETAPQAAIDGNPAWKAFADKMKGEPRASHDDVLWADAIVFGSPTRFGNVASQFKSFIDSLGGLWFQGKLANKVYAGFTSAQNPHGGQESTLLALYTTIYHFGGYVVTTGYTDKTVFASGGNPYGPSVTASGSGPTEHDLAVAQYLGKRVHDVAAKLK